MSQEPYAIISDIHLHKWSQFAGVTDDGQNTRLVALLSEIRRAAQTVLAAGGRHMKVAGDLFHVRGNIAPSVLNPTLDLFRELAESGIRFDIIPGNHDLEGKNSERLGSAVEALGHVEGIWVSSSDYFDHEQKIVLVPWFDSVADLKQKLVAIATELAGAHTFYDLIIHAPINGVILGIPDHGLEPEWLKDLGFKRVFAGHYHNHVEFPGGIFSVGALAHHSWSDVGSKAGFLLVYPDRVEHHPSILPSFVDITPDMKLDAIAAAVKGNYARVKVTTSKLSEIEKMRAWLKEQGALDVVILSVKKPTEERGATGAPTVEAGASIEQSISQFVKSKGFDPALVADIEKGALRVLAEAEIA